MSSSSTVTLPTGGTAYLARPAEPTGTGVIVAHQLFGVTADVREAADRLAALGHTAIAPDFYHRSEPGVQLPATDEGRTRGFALMHELTRAGVLADVAAARDALDTARTAVLGLSLGGHLAYYAATRLPIDLTLVLYAGWLTGTDIPVSRPEPTLDLTPGIKGRLVYIVGDSDHVVTAADRATIAASLDKAAVNHAMIVIPGAPHAFLAAPGPATDQAWTLIERELAALGGA